MTDPQDLIHPYIYNAEMEGGLTKREYFAAMAMMGICSGNEDINRNYYVNHCAELSAKLADALIEALNKQEVKPWN